MLNIKIKMLIITINIIILCLYTPVNAYFLGVPVWKEGGSTGMSWETDAELVAEASDLARFLTSRGSSNGHLYYYPNSRVLPDEYNCREDHVDQTQCMAEHLLQRGREISGSVPPPPTTATAWEGMGGVPPTTMPTMHYCSDCSTLANAKSALEVYRRMFTSCLTYVQLVANTEHVHPTMSNADRCFKAVQCRDCALSYQSTLPTSISNEKSLVDFEGPTCSNVNSITCLDEYPEHMQKMNQLADISWNNTAAADGGDERPQFQFTNGWHMFRIHLWSAALSHLKGRPAVHALEIGVHEGQASTWLLLNILSHPSSSLVCVDWWDGDGYDGSEQYVNAKGVRLRHAHNVKATGMGDRVTRIQGDSKIVLRTKLGSMLEHYDLIYVDGSHQAVDVLQDAVLAWGLLKSGGTMIFDDYQWQQWEWHVGVLTSDWMLSAEALLHSDVPRPAIDAFLHVMQRELEVIHVGFQVVVRKK